MSSSPPALTQIVIAPANPQIAKGDAIQLGATGMFADHSEGPLAGSPTWQTSNPAIATVNAQGNVTGMDEGAAQISASYEGITATTSVNVGTPALVSITVSAEQSSSSGASQAILPMGESEQLTATGNYSDGSVQNLTQSASWSSSSAAIASVSAAGMAVANAVGAATITATSGSVTGSVSLTVTPPVVTAVNVIPAKTSLSLGTSGSLEAMATLSDGSTLNVSALAAWSSSQPTVATVTALGAVNSVAQGVATIAAAYQGATASAAVAVGPAALTSVAVTLPQPSLPVGESEQLTATGKFTDGSTQNLTQSVNWSSSEPAASVNAAGRVVANAAGTTTISATSGSVTGTAGLSIVAAVATAIGIVPASLSVPLGASQPLKAIATLSNGTTQDVTASATWTSAQPKIAAVNAPGNVTGAGRGSAVVSAAYQALTSSASVSVGPPALVSIAVSPSQLSLPLGESEQLAATGHYTDGSTQNLTQTATWSAYGAGANVASVKAGGSVLAAALGTITISATSGTITGTATVTVTAPVVVAVNIVPATLTLVLGSSGRFQAMANFSDGTVQDLSATAEWTSTQSNIATVSGGVITTSQVGSTTILAEVNNFTGSASLTVMPLFLVNYFSRVSAVNSGIDGTIQVINPGLNSASQTPENMCAMVYVFDQKQELNECCGCTISDSGLLTLSLLNDLTGNTLTGRYPRAGQIKIVPSDPAQNPQCNPTSLAPTSQLAAWGTHSQPAGSGTFQVTESEFEVRPLTNTEASDLVNECSYARQLGSGAGICTCGSGD